MQKDQEMCSEDDNGIRWLQEVPRWWSVSVQITEVV